MAKDKAKDSGKTKKAKDVGEEAPPVIAEESATWPNGRPNYTSLAAAVQGETARFNIPGVQVAIFHKGTLDVGVAGVADLVTKQPVTPETIFQIGSISKIFTTTVALSLVDEGKLDLDTPIVTWVPELPLADEEARTTITLRHIFSHSAGFEGDTFEDYGRGTDSVLKAVLDFGKLEQWFRPGELFSYNNNGFVLAALVMERVTGQEFEQLVQERIFTPLKLESSVYFAENAITYPHALGHFLKKREDGYEIAKPYSFPRQINAPGGIIGTAADLVRFAQAHANGGELDGARILKQETAELMQTPIINSWDQYTSYGQGWWISEYPGLRVVVHGGSTLGFKATLRFSPEEDFFFAALTNGDPGASAYESLWEWALKHYLDYELPENEPIELGKKELDGLTGLYARQNMRIKVTRDKKHIVVRAYDIDPESGEEKDDGRPESSKTFRLEPFASQRPFDFQVIDGPSKGTIFQFLPRPEKDDPDRILIRVGGRTAARAEGPFA